MNSINKLIYKSNFKDDISKTPINKNINMDENHLKILKS